MKPSFFRRLIAWARGEPRYTSNEQRRAAFALKLSNEDVISIAENYEANLFLMNGARAFLDEELKKPLVFGYADRPRADDLKALGLKESDFTSPARPQ